MVAGHDASPYTDDDPAAATSDALSLHTIADQADEYEYAAQEQEDADFALALQLEEEEEARNLIESQSPPPPYRDDPDTGESFPPYRDDPNAVPAATEASFNAEVDATTARRDRLRGCVRILRKIGKIWLCLGVTSFSLGILVVLVIIIIAASSRQKDGQKLEDEKRRAWTASGSRDFDIKLPQLYPKLEEGATDECKAGWKKYASALYCHRMILDPAWDYGDADEVRKAGADPFVFSEVVCTAECRDSIRHIDNPMYNTCFRRTDRFDFTKYGKDGYQYFETDKLPEGPRDLVLTLLARYDRYCAKPLKGADKSEWGTCAADLWMRWGVVDGKNEAHLNGLSEFTEATSEKKTIEGGPREVESEIMYGGGAKKKVVVNVPTRKVGPGLGDTDCGYCTLDWLERKMRSFEYGQMIDPASGEILGLADFNKKLHAAVRRCGMYESGWMLGRVHRKWAELGWWSKDGMAHEPLLPDNRTTEEVRKILHGMRPDDWPLPDIKKQMNAKSAPKKALQALHDSVASMPCSIWFSEDAAIRDIIPHAHIVSHLCSDRCRNAVDRIQNEHGDDFAAAASTLPTANIFQAWDLARDQANKTCKGSGSSPCAPGYAALGHPEWIFASTTPSKPTILFSFSTAIDELERKLPRYERRPKEDKETARILERKVLESVCNGCTGDLLIGRNPDWAKAVKEWVESGEVDPNEYKRTARKYFKTCWKFYGAGLTPKQLREFFDQIGLDGSGD